MRHKIKDAPEEYVAKDQCHHYWVIEIANGPTSKGACKLCGTVKEFFNVMPDPTVVKRNTNPLDLPELPDVKLDKESKS